MKVALVNPHWDFARSIYFGCRPVHLPVELGHAKALLERLGMMLRKLCADVVVRGEFAEVVAMLTGAADLAAIPAIVFAEDDAARIASGPHAPRFTDPPALQRPDEWGSKHHHRFDRKPERPGAEVEASHGCSHPYPNSNWSAARLTDV